MKNLKFLLLLACGLVLFAQSAIDTVATVTKIDGVTIKKFTDGRVTCYVAVGQIYNGAQGNAPALSCLQLQQ